jgi:hypothetical protein
MSDDTKRVDEAMLARMPAELRPYAKPVPAQPLVAPEDEAQFKAYLDVLRLLNGGPDADPFHPPTDPGPAPPPRAAPPSVRAYVPPTTVAPAEAMARDAAPAKVVIAEAAPRAAPLVTHHAQRIDTRPFREAWEARQAAEKAAAGEAAAETPPAATGGDEDARDEITLAKSEDPRQGPGLPGSPWATEAPDAESVRSSALPSSLRPRDVTAEGSAGAAKGRMKALLVGAIVVVGVAIVVRAATRGPGPEVAPAGPPSAAVRATATVKPATSAGPTPATSTPTSATVEPAPPSAVPAPTVAPAPQRPHGTGPQRHDPGDDPYGEDAAPPPPRPPKTAAPVAPPAPTPPLPTAPPVPTVSPELLHD